MTCPHCEEEMDCNWVKPSVIDWYCSECDYHDERENYDDPPFARPVYIPGRNIQ